MIDLNKLGDPGTFEVRQSDYPNSEYSVAFYYDDDGSPALKEKATKVNIVLYDKNDHRINEVYGSFNH